MVITGDLTVTGTRREFELVNSTLKSLWEFFRSLGSNPSLLAVPGDHDVSSRGGPLRNFTEWFAGWRRANPGDAVVHEAQVPGDFVATLASKGLKVGVVGLHAAFGPRYALSLAKAEESLGVKLQDWAMRHNLVLMLTHVGPELLDPTDMAQLRQQLSPAACPFLHLCGRDDHEEAWGDAAWLLLKTRCLQAPSLFSDRRQGVRKLGYAAGQVSLSVNDGVFRFFPRAVYENNGQILVGPLRQQLEADEALHFPLEVLRGKAPAAPPQAPSRPANVFAPVSLSARAPRLARRLRPTPLFGCWPSRLRLPRSRPA